MSNARRRLEQVRRMDRNRRMGIRVGTVTEVDGGRIAVNYGRAEAVTMAGGSSSTFAGQSVLTSEQSGNHVILATVPVLMGTPNPGSTDRPG